ncbi:MAG: cyclic nucleotide-binding domain-containing protein [Actinomycetia bacterium]|nr:cyclic nucleotide-binding domain-containing protein [Actinomycetes bacterium]
MNLDDLRAASDLLSRLDDKDFDLFESLSTELTLVPDELLFKEHDDARRFFIIESGIIALEAIRPAKPATTIQTLGIGDLLGLSWRLTPHRWMWSARAMTDVRLAVFDAAIMRAACEFDADLDRLMWEIVAREASKRLHHTRVQLLDLYGRE